MERIIAHVRHLRQLSQVTFPNSRILECTLPAPSILALFSFLLISIAQSRCICTCVSIQPFSSFFSWQFPNLEFLLVSNTARFPFWTSPFRVVSEYYYLIPLLVFLSFIRFHWPELSLRDYEGVAVSLLIFSIQSPQIAKCVLFRIRRGFNKFGSSSFSWCRNCKRCQHWATRSGTSQPVSLTRLRPSSHINTPFNYLDITRESHKSFIS